MPLTFGQYIADARKRAGLSQKDLAAKLQKEDGDSISPQYLNDIEHDRRNAPSEHLLDQLADLLELPEGFLYFRAGQWPKNIRGSESQPEQFEAALKVLRKALEKNKP